MGVKYSTGALPPKIAKKMGNISMVRIESLMNKFKNRRKKAITLIKRNEMFASRDEVQWLFQLTSMQVYTLFQLMDKTRQFRISLFDLWGALILLATDIGVEGKVENIFALIDENNTGWLPLRDLRLLIICSMRGLSHIKNIHIFTEYSVDKFIRSMLTFSELNEQGEISLNNVRAYLLMDENARAYFSALGAETVVLDTGMLVKQRREVLQSLADTERAIRELEYQERITEEDRITYEKERGGDSSALRIQNVAAERQGQDDDEAADIVEDTWGEPTLEQRQRRLQRAKAMNASKGNMLISDAVIYSDPNARKANKSSGSSFDENSVARKWTQLACDTEDGLRELNIDVVEDLFEHAGIILTDEVADEYMNKVSSNALNKRNLHDLLQWYRDRVTTAAPIRGKPPLWRELATRFAEDLGDFYAKLQSVPSGLNKQKAVMDAIKKKEIYCEQVRFEEEAAEARRLEEVAAAKAAREERRRARKAKKLGKSYAPPKKEQKEEPQRMKKKEKAKAGVKKEGVDIAGDLQGSVRFAAWYRQQLANPEANKINLRITFGHPEDVVVEKPKEEQAGEKLKKLLNKGKKTKKEKKPDPYKMKLKFNANVIIPGNDRPLFFDPKTCTIKDPGFTSINLLDHFKKQNFDEEGGTLPETLFGSVAWTAFTIAKGTSPEEEHILSETITNFFNAIPEEYRCGTYSTVQTQFLNMPAEGSEGEDGDDDDGVDGNNTEKKRVLIIALLHEVDRFFEMEQEMPAGVLLTRSVRSLALQLQLVPNLYDLYEHSVPYESFEDRLFGPQEDELGEEGMNPLRFAKLQRQRTNAVKEAIEKCENMNKEKLQEGLQARGFSPNGDIRDLVRRMKKAFQRQAEISGFGELSAFGSDMSKRIFADFWRNKEGGGDPKMVVKQVPGKEKRLTMREKAKAEAEAAERAEREAKEPKGMTLWDFNDLLFRTGTETIYDWKEYKTTLENLEFLTDKNSNIMSEGLSAYHEQYGGLSADMRNLGIGGLDDVLKGELMLSSVMDGEGLNSLMKLLEPHSILQWLTKYILTFFISITDLTYEADYDRASELFQLGSSEMGLNIAEIMRSPGWISGSIHNMMQWLADGDEGAMVSLRAGVHTYFGRYSKYDDIFPEAVKKPETTSSSADVAKTDDNDNDNDNDEKKDDTQDESDGKKGNEEEENESVDREARKAEAQATQAEKDYELFLARLADLLPPKSDGMSPNINTEHLKRLVALLNRVNSILSDYDSFPVSRDESEGLMLLREELDKNIQDCKLRIEESKQLCCAHLCSAYDAIRTFTDGVSSVGWGTKEFCTRGFFTGMDIVQFLPKGYGEPCIPQLKKMEKLERAAARKAAAFAALERERIRRNADSEENKEKRAAKQAALAAKRVLEENKLFTEANDKLVAARFGGKSAAELGEIARMWEKLGSMTQSRYPDTIKACIHMSNSAVALRDLYSVDHFKGKEAISRLNKASALAISIFEQFSDVKREGAKVQSKRQRDEQEEAESKMLVVVVRESDPLALRTRDSVASDSLAASNEQNDSEDEGEKSLVGSVDDDGLYLRPRETVKLPDEIILPIFCVLQNYLSIIREAKNNFLLGKTERLKRIILGILHALTEQEIVPLMEKNARPPFEANEILICGIVKDEVALTSGEIRAIDAEMEEEIVHEDTESEGEKEEKRIAKEEADAERRRREQETVAARNARRGANVGGRGGRLPGVSQEEEDAEEMIRKEREAKREKYARQRKLDEAKRLQTIKQRMKLYHLIDSDKISKIFAKQSASVLADGQDINWGDEGEEQEIERFLDDSTQATSSSESSSDDEETKKRKKKEARKEEKKREKEAQKLEAAAMEAEKAKSSSAGDGDESEKSDDKGSRGGFFNFLFRNRDTA